MKVLFYQHTPFSLAHGGLSIQILRTREALEKLGVEVDFLRWYDGTQTADVIHFFGRIPVNLLALAHQKGIKVVMAELLTESSSRPLPQLKKQKFVMRWWEKLMPGMTARTFAWQSYRLVDACVALTAWEAQLMTELFAAPPEKISIVPNGVEQIFLQSTPMPRGPWLVCVATIAARKRIVELAAAAVHAKTPLWIIGKPYGAKDPYANRFFHLVKEYPQLIRYDGEIQDRAELTTAYREARGFVLLSAMESLSLSALEAAACECPLLLSDLPWARSAFPNQAVFCPIADTATTSPILRQFYDAAPTLPLAAKPVTWLAVAAQLKSLYATLFNTSR